MLESITDIEVQHIDGACSNRAVCDGRNSSEHLKWGKWFGYCTFDDPMCGGRHCYCGMGWKRWCSTGAWFKRRHICRSHEYSFGIRQYEYLCWNSGPWKKRRYSYGFPAGITGPYSALWDKCQVLLDTDSVGVV